MAWGLAVAAGISAISGAVQSRKKNKLIQARQAWLGEEKKYQKKIFEAQTFSKHYQKESAGATRIANSAALGGGIGGASVMNQWDEIFLQTDLALDKFRQEHELKRLDNAMAGLESQKTSVLKTAAWGALFGAADYTTGHLSAGGDFGDLFKVGGGKKNAAS